MVIEVIGRRYCLVEVRKAGREAAKEEVFRGLGEIVREVGRRLGFCVLLRRLTEESFLGRKEG